YRAQVLQREVIWRQMLPLRRQGRKGLPKLVRKMVDYLFSWLLDLFVGYGYKPGRALITYLLIIGIYTVLYSMLGTVYGPHLSWWGALGVSMTAFHGRVFFPEQFQVSGAQAFTAATEAFVGLLIEVGLIVTIAQRFFRT
ncbi:MAG: hypothetical protein M3Z24_16345, partial [Chloroflexota bacterium]|nr:hypothetical protein [Chloroflexota bacterium]